MTTAEPIEVLTALIALIGVVKSAGLAYGAIRTSRAANGQRQSVRMIAQQRAVSELIHLSIALAILYAGVTQVVSAAPAVPGAARTTLQWIWLGLAVVVLALSVWNEHGSKRLVRQIEAESS